MTGDRLHRVPRADEVVRSTAAAATIPVVEPLSLAIAEGEFVVFVGPSGCGKTTVMRMVGGLETPTTGEVRLAGRRVDGPSREKGMVFQSYSSFPWLTVLGNIRFGLKYRRDVAAAEKERIARHYLDLVGLTPFADFIPTGSPAACASAWRSPARWRPTRWCC